MMKSESHYISEYFDVGDLIVISKNEKIDRWNSKGLMDKYIGKTVTISKKIDRGISFNLSFGIVEDNGEWAWFPEMIDVEASLELKKRYKILSLII